MPSAPAQPPFSEAPLYIRWGPDRCPYAIELKLELVDRLHRALVEANSRELEIGGVLVGTLPTAQAPTLRIEEVELLARRAEDGATFMLEGGGSERFAEVRRRARARERSTVGLFRSHLRPGPLRPSLADRTLLAGEFKEPVYALLLAQAVGPFNAAFFVASNGPLPAEMSVREFQLNPADFRALPELEPELSAGQNVGARPSRQSGLRTAGAVLLIVLCVIGILYYLNQSLFPEFSPSASALQLTVQSQDGLLRISWNHNARYLDHSTGAMLTIRGADGAYDRRIRLGLDELRLGVIAYESNAPKVQVTLAVENPGTVSTSQSVVWGE